MVLCLEGYLDYEAYRRETIVRIDLAGGIRR